MPCDDLEGWDGGREVVKREGRYIYIHTYIYAYIVTTDWCCCMAEMDTTLLSNFFPVKKIFKYIQQRKKNA